MVRNKTVLNLGILLALFWSFLAIASAQAENTTAQILTQVDEILAMNPPKAGEKIQLINVAQTDAVSVFIIKVLQGGEVKPHNHKTHEETVYVIKGSGQMLVNDKWVDMEGRHDSLQSYECSARRQEYRRRATRGCLCIYAFYERA